MSKKACSKVPCDAEEATVSYTEKSVQQEVFHVTPCSNVWVVSKQANMEEKQITQQ
jgi:uncharacterized damage-inducible protein DinB